jgi:uncharacterized OsmC-like protein
MSFASAITGLQTAITKDASAGAVSFRANHELVGPTEVEVRIGNHQIRIDEPPVLGGNALGPNPVEVALAALGSCQAITYRVWAQLQGVRIDRISVRVDGDLDLRGFFGVDSSVRPGFTGVRVVVSLSGPETEERYREFQKQADRFCPVLDLFQNSTPVTTVLEVEAEVEPQIEAIIA